MAKLIALLPSTHSASVVMQHTSHYKSRGITAYVVDGIEEEVVVSTDDELHAKYMPNGVSTKVMSVETKTPEVDIETKVDVVDIKTVDIEVKDTQTTPEPVKATPEPTPEPTVDIPEDLLCPYCGATARTEASYRKNHGDNCHQK